MTLAELRAIERSLELHLCQVTARLHPPLEHPLKPDQLAIQNAELERKIRAGLASLATSLGR